jgi:hypothetical protein
MPGHTYDVDVYIEKDRAHVIADVTATHASRTLDRKGRGIWM